MPGRLLLMSGRGLRVSDIVGHFVRQGSINGKCTTRKTRIAHRKVSAGASKRLTKY